MMAAMPEDSEALWIHQGKEMDNQEETETWLGPSWYQEVGTKLGVGRDYKGGGPEGLIDIFLGPRISNSPTILKAYS